jgi:glycosyltransferase involved in cell wall biosynthesis
MKILHIINGQYYSGAERVQDLLVQTLPSYGIDAYLVCIKPDKFKQRCECDKNKVFELDGRYKSDYARYRFISRFIVENNVKIIHTHTPRSGLLGYFASRNASVPLVHHVHSPTIRDTEKYFRNNIKTFVENIILRQSEAIVAVSGSLKSYLLRSGFSDSKVHVVHNGIKPLHSLPSKEEPSSTWMLGIVALFRPRKGLEVLLECLRKLLDSTDKNVHLRAIGEFETKEYEREIKNLTAKLRLENNITWVGFSNNVQSELQSIDLLILPSLYGEGLPMVILEAMGNGVPVVSTCVEGVLEAIPTNNHGIIVEPNDVISLYKGISEIIESKGLWSIIRSNAHKYQSEQLSDMAMSKGVSDIYKMVVTNGSRKG